MTRRSIRLNDKTSKTLISAKRRAICKKIYVLSENRWSGKIGFCDVQGKEAASVNMLFSASSDSMFRLLGFFDNKNRRLSKKYHFLTIFGKSKRFMAAANTAKSRLILTMI